MQSAHDGDMKLYAIAVGVFGALCWANTANALPRVVPVKPSPTLTTPLNERALQTECATPPLLYQRSARLNEFARAGPFSTERPISSILSFDLFPPRAKLTVPTPRC